MQLVDTSCIGFTCVFFPRAHDSWRGFGKDDAAAKSGQSLLSSLEVVFGFESQKDSIVQGMLLSNHANVSFFFVDLSKFLNNDATKCHIRRGQQYFHIKHILAMHFLRSNLGRFPNSCLTLLSYTLKLRRCSNDHDAT